MLRGRDVESQRLSVLLSAAHAERAGSLVVTGGAGVGKSALLEDLAIRAADVTVLRITGPRV